MADEIIITAVGDQLWRGVIVKASQVDGGGNMELYFDIIDANTGEIIYPGQYVTGSADGIIKQAQTVAAELRQKIEQAETIKAGDEFEI